MSPELLLVEPGPPTSTQSASLPDDMVSMLDQLAQTIVEALGFGVAVVNITLSDGSLQVVSVAGDENARAALLNHVDTAETWEVMLSASEPWGRLRFVDHRTDDRSAGALSWVPDVEMVDADDAWHPEDALFAPLISEDGAQLGILSVDLPHDGRRPDAGSRRALEAFAMAAALAIEHSTLRARAEAAERSARQLAIEDPLTGVGNRAMLMQRLTHAASARPGRRDPLALVFIDLNDFKPINDVHSHAAGDLVLQETAARITHVVRPHDTVVRWGGDEFVVLLEQVEDEEGARRVAERLAEAIAEPIVYSGSKLAVTASVGLAFDAGIEELDLDALMRRADAAMYEMKHSR